LFPPARGSQEPLLKDEIENPEPPAEEQQKVDAPFLSLNKTGTAILAVSVISVIGVLAWKLILARRKITEELTDLRGQLDQVLNELSDLCGYIRTKEKQWNDIAIMQIHNENLERWVSTFQDWIRKILTEIQI
jgi:hypothetical protein